MLQPQVTAQHRYVGVNEWGGGEVASVQYPRKALNKDGRREPVTKPLALGKAVHKAIELKNQWYV